MMVRVKIVSDDQRIEQDIVASEGKAGVIEYPEQLPVNPFCLLRSEV
jgi:hypothetical protein